MKFIAQATIPDINLEKMYKIEGVDRDILWKIHRRCRLQDPCRNQQEDWKFNSCTIITPENFILMLCTLDHGEPELCAKFVTNQFIRGLFPSRWDITCLWLSCPYVCLSMCLCVCICVCRSGNHGDSTQLTTLVPYSPCLSLSVSCLHYRALSTMTDIT